MYNVCEYLAKGHSVEGLLNGGGELTVAVSWSSQWTLTDSRWDVLVATAVELLAKLGCYTSFEENATHS